MERLRNITLKEKINILITSSLIMLAVVSFCCTVYINNNYIKKIHDETVVSLNSISDNISSQLSNIASDSTHIVADTTIQKNLSRDYSELDTMEQSKLRSNCESVIYSYLGLSKYIDSIALITPNYSICHGNSSYLESADYLEEILKIADDNKGKEIWVPSKINEETILLVRSIRKIDNLDLSTIGYLVLRIDFNYIASQILRNSGYSYKEITMFVLDEKNSAIIYPSDINDDKSLDFLKSTKSREYSINFINNKLYFVTYKQSQYPAWFFYLMIPYGDIFKAIAMTQIISLFALMVTVGILLFATHKINNNMLIHFDILSQKMTSLRNGKLEPIDIPYDYSKCNDELGKLHQDFDKMLFDFKHLTMDNYTKQILLKDAQMKNMEQQLNPHFLYNTLDVVYWKAQNSSQNDICEIVKSLAMLLRYSLGENKDTISLESEVNFVRDYINIQKYRFENKLCYSEEIDESLFDQEVPKMCVQPLIENAIKYGLETSVSPCNIELKVYRSGQLLMIEVHNDCSEIDEDILSKLEDKSISTAGNGIGLKNIDTRIHLLYGDDYGLFFKSGFDTTTVTIKLPYADKGAVNV